MFLLITTILMSTYMKKKKRYRKREVNCFSRKCVVSVPRYTVTDYREKLWVDFFFVLMECSFERSILKFAEQKKAAIFCLILLPVLIYFLHLKFSLVVLNFKN